MYYRSFIKPDLKYRLSARQSSTKGIWILGGLLLSAAIAVFTAVQTSMDDDLLAQPPITLHSKQHHNAISTPRIHQPVSLPQTTSSPPPVKEIEIQESGTWHEVVIKRGDSLSSIFSRLNVSSQLRKILNIGKEIRPLKSIYPDQKLRFCIHDDVLTKLIYEFNELEQLHITRNANDFTVERVKRPVETRPKLASAKISHSLFEAGLKAGLSDRLIMEVAAIFGWDIDFALDIRSGDRFSVVYEEQFLDGKKIRNGKIIAAEFINQGKIYQAFRYTDARGHTDYYAPDGRSMRKAFLRTPVNLARITSRYYARRRHPILNKIRAHKGVDYAAPMGTPIKATGHGKVVFRGRKGGYGKTLVLKHGHKYTTLYAHMSRYARNTSVGQRVKQGQIIGYIGQSGLATGPHLHYEFRVNGQHRNPLNVALPPAEPLPAQELTRFATTIEPLQTKLDNSKHAVVASNI